MHGEEDIPISAFPPSLFFLAPVSQHVLCILYGSEGANQADRSPGFAGLLPLEYGAEINEGLGPSTRIAGNNPAFGENPGVDT